MDFCRLDEHIQMLQTVGFTLNVEEKLRLKGAAAQLMDSQADLDEVKFWGRIEGLTKSYYIVIGLKYCKSYEFPHKTFYYSLSGDLDFKELPELLVQHQGNSENFNSMPFTGDPNKVLVNVEGDAEGGDEKPPEEEGGQAEVKPVDEDEEELKKVPKKNFTELSRLAYVVRSVENDAQVVPKDSYRMTTEHELRPNMHFKGLQAANCKSPDNWIHFRAPQTPAAKEIMESDMIVFSSGFLDSIGSDKPQGTWSVQIDSRVKNVSARSLLWPGYFAFHRLGSPLFGGVYIGEGCKNVDLPFMI